MKNKILFLAVTLAAFSSCTTLYKSGQTPDDVYYSPARSYDEVAQKQDREEPVNEQANNYSAYNNEDRMIRMGISNSRWRYITDDYSYNPYNNFYNSPYNNNFAFGNNHGFYGLNSNYYAPNYNSIYYSDFYYNPYYSAYPVYYPPITLVKPRVSTPRQINLNGYGSNYNNANTPVIRRNTPTPGQSSRTYNNSNKNSGLGNILNKVFAPAPSNRTNNNNTYNNNTDNSPQRTYTPAPSSNSNSSSGNSGSSSSSGGKISRPN